MQALSEIVRAGKVRWIGFSEWSPEQIEAAFATSRRRAVRLQPSRNTRCCGDAPNGR